MHSRGEERIEALRRERGPLVVINKGHSGSRFLAEALQRSGVHMGADLNPMFDSLAWHVEFGVPLITSDYYPGRSDFADPAFSALADRVLESTLDRYLGDGYAGGPWGWKGSTLFVTDIVHHYFPDIRLLHLIRDGRDVCLSEDGKLNLPFRRNVWRRNPVNTARAVAAAIREGDDRDRYRLKVFFGDADITEWNGIELDRSSAVRNRYLLQMQSWCNNVDAGRRMGELLGDQYLELRYEDLCTEPREVMRTALEFLGLEPSADVLDFVAANARTTSLGKWRHLDLDHDRQDDFDRACIHGQPLLADLGYVDA